MTLREFLEKNWVAVKMYFEMGDNHIPGRIYYRLTEMDFDGFSPKTYISEAVKKGKNHKSIKKILSRHNLNWQLKNMFKNEDDYAFLEHIVPSKYILENWKKNINNKDAFEKYLRDEAAICILMKSEEKNNPSGKSLPRTKGRETLEKSLAIYADHEIIIEEFKFDNIL